jgi:hypothetical protein
MQNPAHSETTGQWSSGEHIAYLDQPVGWVKFNAPLQIRLYDLSELSGNQQPCTCDFCRSACNEVLPNQVAQNRSELSAG